ncbi:MULTISPECIES: GNAT family N-acetyltransferase [unclassified Streptomyces]|uniref:GNAT family N-acetyltransferase n=1 Tax=unclassified Streptomyces TaxID=2593676 RepID=UPI0037FA13D7
MTRMTWTFSPERVDTPDAVALRRDYYDEVASRYWKRPATAAEIDEGLTDDGAGLLAPPTGDFRVARFGGEPAGCGGVLLLDDGGDGDGVRAELTRVYLRPAFRGRGGAGLLMDALEDAARTLGARRTVLNTRLDLVEARSLYVRHGYAEIPAYCTGPYMDVWYGKKL